MKGARKKWHKYSVHLCIVMGSWKPGMYLATHKSRNFGGATPEKGTTPRLFQNVSIDILSRKSVKIVVDDGEATSLPCVQVSMYKRCTPLC